MTARKQGAPVRRGSASPSEAYRRSVLGETRLQLRIPAAVAALLEGEAERSGYSCSQLVEEMIRIELDPTHEGYVGPRQSVRCDAYVNRVRCDRAAVYSTGLCERCQLLRDDEQPSALNPEP